mgnify:CR=1 FL=1
MNNKTYAICNLATDLKNIDFSQVGESSASTIIKDVTVKPSQTLTHSEALELMSTAAWSQPEPVEE